MSCTLTACMTSACACYSLSGPWHAERPHLPRPACAAACMQLCLMELPGQSYSPHNSTPDLPSPACAAAAPGALPDVAPGRSLGPRPHLQLPRAPLLHLDQPQPLLGCCSRPIQSQRWRSSGSRFPPGGLPLWLGQLLPRQVGPAAAAGRAQSVGQSCRAQRQRRSPACRQHWWAGIGRLPPRERWLWPTASGEEQGAVRQRLVPNRFSRGSSALCI